MEPILRFLQLLCENHNRDLQVSFVSYIARIRFPSDSLNFLSFYAESSEKSK